MELGRFYADYLKFCIELYALTQVYLIGQYYTKLPFKFHTKSTQNSKVIELENVP